ncbi:hypothetical protein [Paenibacillus aceris]|uniref:Uncharacterized protein n=1 Tax=Paenibacillus aceris TaxID=869555 RepID=A0ABS4I8C4_9BACL|nr:hypothetical protein [Paenibacillus aceris]MBP1967187.1 hypothetical protein [Paenibacillus aceris]NHW35582.1 hypothetical protein [Paenibacillus aceris]
MLDTTELKKFMVEKKPFEEAIDGFWGWIKSWKEDDPEDYFNVFGNEDISTIELTRERIALVINCSFDTPIEFIQTTLNVIYKEDLIAQYYYLQNFNGEVIDDVLSFEKYSLITKND